MRDSIRRPTAGCDRWIHPTRRGNWLLESTRPDLRAQRGNPQTAMSEPRHSRGDCAFSLASARERCEPRRGATTQWARWISDWRGIKQRPGGTATWNLSRSDTCRPPIPGIADDPVTQDCGVRKIEMPSIGGWVHRAELASRPSSPRSAARLRDPAGAGGATSDQAGGNRAIPPRRTYSCGAVF